MNKITETDLRMQLLRRIKKFKKLSNKKHNINRKTTQKYMTYDFLMNMQWTKNYFYSKKMINY